MKLIVKNKVFSLGGGSIVTNEDGTTLYKVKGKILSIRRKKIVMDLSNQKLFVIKNKLFNFWTHKSFIYNAQKEKIACVKNRGFKGGYDVLGYGDEISLEGWGVKGYTVLKNGSQIGEVKSNILGVADNYEVTVADNENPAFIVALIIAIDNVRDNAIKR